MELLTNSAAATAAHATAAAPRVCGHPTASGTPCRKPVPGARKACAAHASKKRRQRREPAPSRKQLRVAAVHRKCAGGEEHEHEEEETCAVCMCEPATRRVGCDFDQHVLCEGCLKRITVRGTLIGSQRAVTGHRCPFCRAAVGTLTGDSPSGFVVVYRKPGLDIFRVEVSFARQYATLYLRDVSPNCALVRKLLVAFDRRLCFTRSRRSGPAGGGDAPITPTQGLVFKTSPRAEDPHGYPAGEAARRAYEAELERRLDEMLGPATVEEIERCHEWPAAADRR